MTPGESTVVPLGSVTTGSTVPVSPPVPAEPVHDRLVGLEPLLARDGELLVHGLARLAGGGHADQGQHEPEADDDALVGQDPAGETSHGTTSKGA